MIDDGNPFGRDRSKARRPDKIMVWQSTEDGQWYWHRKNGWNGQVTARGEGYVNKADAVDTARKSGAADTKLYVEGELQ